MAISVDPQTEHDLTMISSEYRRRGTHVTPATLIEEIVLALQEILHAEQPSEHRNDLTDEERAILQRGGFDLEVHDDAPDPYRRTQIKFATLIADSFTTAEAAETLRVTTSRIRQMLGTRALFGIKWKSGWRVPRFQFDGDRLVPHVSRVFPHLDPALDGIGIFNWFTFPNDDLRDAAYREMSPRDWLIAGRNWEPVAEQATFL
jgi:hypothetical protein